MKKILRSMLVGSLLLSIMGIGTASVVTASSENVVKSTQSAVLSWGTFSNSARDSSKPLDCKDTEMKTYLDAQGGSDDARRKLFEGNESKNNLLIADVKACLMETKVDKYATWFIFLGISVLVGFLIFLGIKIAIGSEGEGGGGGGMPGGGMPGQGGGGGGIWEKIKPAIIGIAVLTFVLVGGLNALLLLLKFIVDLFIK